MTNYLTFYSQLHFLNIIAIDTEDNEDKDFKFDDTSN